MTKFLLYLGRWQLSGFVLGPVLAIMTGAKIYDPQIIAATMLSNLIGGVVFFWVDKFLIFNGGKK